jgi:hypothetical protein
VEKRVEHRIAPRFEIHAPVEYRGHDSAGSGTTANVSTSGVRIETPTGAKLEVGTDVTLRFSFFVGSFGTSFDANVVRHTSDGSVPPPYAPSRATTRSGRSRSS